MNQIKETIKLNRDVINKASDELGIPEEKIPLLVEKMLENPKSRDLLFKALGEFVGRRAFIGGMAGVGAGFALTGLVGAKTVITDKNVIIDDEWFLKAPMPFSAIVFKEDGLVKALDWKGKEIASGTDGVDDASVIQSAIGSISEGTVVCSGTFVLTSPIQLVNKRVRLVGYSSKLTPATNNMNIVEITQPHGSFVQTILEGFKINGNGYTGITAIRVYDKYRAKITNMEIRNVQRGILIESVNGWSEGTTIEKVFMEDVQTAIEFLKTGGTGSFANTHVKNIEINMLNTSGTGIKINNGVGLIRSTIEDVLIWIHNDNSTGIFVDGNINGSTFRAWLESFVTAPSSLNGIEIGTNAINTHNAKFEVTYWNKDFTNKVYNPDDKPVYVLYSPSYNKVPIKYGLTAVQIGTNDIYGNPLRIRPIGYGALDLGNIQIVISGTFGTGEIITVKIETVDSEGGILSIEKSYTAIASEFLSDFELWNITPSNNRWLWGINIYAKTNLSSTGVTVQIRKM